MTSIRELVERYTALGLVVVPVSGKRPASVVLDERGRPMRRPDGSPVRWQPFVERFPTDAELEAFEWDRATGLALVIGDATWQDWPYLWCLDVEQPHRDAAERWLDECVAGWRDGAVVETGSGGLHVYFLATQPVRTQVVAWGEVRGRGALCVVPPSTHPETARRYRWLSERWTNLPTLEPAVVPGYQLAGGSSANGQPHEPVDVARALEGAPLGERNRTLFRLTSRLRGAGVPVEWATALVSAAAANCIPPWGSAPDEEPPEKLVQRVYARYQPAPELVSERGREHLGGGSSSSSSLGNVNVMMLEPVDLAAVPDPGPVEWLVDRLIPNKFATNLYADSGQGKSFLALWLAACVVAGRPFLGRRTKQGRVVYLDWELDAPTQAHRWRAVARGMGLDEPPPGLVYVRPRAPITRLADQVLGLVVEHQPVLVVVDSVGKALAGDPNDPARVIELYDLLDRLGVAVLCIDHQPKPAGESYVAKWEYGSAYKRHLARQSWQLERTGGDGGVIGLALHCKKSNFGPLEPPLYATLIFDGDAVRVESAERGPAGKAHGLRGAILDLLAGQPLTADQLAEALPDYDPGSVRNALTELKRAGAIDVVGRAGRAPLYTLASQLVVGRPEPNEGQVTRPDELHHNHMCTVYDDDELRATKPNSVLTRAEQQVLEVLRSGEGLTLDELADRTGLNRSSVARALQRLLYLGSVNCWGEGQRGAPRRWYAVPDQTTPVRNDQEESKPNSVLLHGPSPSSLIYSDGDGDDGATKPNSVSSKDSSMDETGRDKTEFGFHSSKPHSLWDETKPGQSATTSPASDQPGSHAGLHQPGDGVWASRQVLELLTWCGRLLGQLERGETVLGPVEYRAGHVVADHEAFLRSNLAEAERGAALAVARLVSYRRAVEASQRPS